MLYLIDASVYVFRAYYSMPPDMLDREGNAAHALFGFARFLGDLIERAKPRYLAVAFDESLETSFRNRIDPTYKANREPAPADLKLQFGRCREFCEHLGVAHFGSGEYEADDIIGTLHARFRREGLPATLVTRDKDLAQLVREGDVFTLEGSVKGRALSARTVVPGRPTGARMVSSTLTIPTLTFGGPGGPRPDFSAAQTLVRWTKSPGSLYFVTLENVELSPVGVDIAFPGGIRGRRRVIFAPTAADSLPVNALGLPYYGRYQVYVWRVNEEYAQLYATLQQDSRDLNEPFTNITGGLGVFTAFAADTTSVTVIKK